MEIDNNRIIRITRPALYYLGIILFFNIAYAEDVYVNKPQLGDSATNARLEALEKGLNILQKYVYNLHVAQDSNSAAARSTPQEVAVNMDEISDQFKSIRADIEKLQHEMGHTNDKILQISADTERRLHDLEIPARQNAEATKLAEKIEAQLVEITPNSVSSKGSQSHLRSTVGESAEDSFKHAYLLVQERKFSEAKVAFENFKKQYPKNNLLGAAHYWLGEIYMEEGYYDKAALEYLAGYQCGVVSGRAPDNLMRLGEVLMRLGKRQEACITFSKLEKEFPNAPSSIQRRSQKMSKESACR